jgi:hypothetical protein
MSTRWEVAIQMLNPRDACEPKRQLAFLVLNEALEGVVHCGRGNHNDACQCSFR